MASAVLFYLGAGQGERAEACKQRYQPTHTVLVDGQAHAEGRLDSVQQASVKRVWVTHDGQPATFYHYNLAEFDGLRKASALKELFPNLKLKSSEDVETVAVHQLVGETLADQGGNNHVLVIDIPGQELALLQALAEHELIQRFEYIEVVTCQEAWFDGVNVTTEAAAQLKEYGFKAVTATLDDDPDFPVLAVYRDAVAEENRVLKTRLKQSEDAQKHLEAEKQALQEEKQKQANWAQSLKKQLEEAQQAIEAQTKDLEAAQQAAKIKEQELSEAKQLTDERKKQVDELKRQLEFTQQAEDKLSKELDGVRQANKIKEQELSAHIKATAEKDELIKKANELNAQLNDEKKAKQNTIDSQKSKLEELEKVKTQIAKVEKEKSELKYQLEEITLSFESNRKKLISQESKYAEVKAVNEKLQTEFSVLKGQLELLRSLRREA